MSKNEVSLPPAESRLKPLNPLPESKRVQPYTFQFSRRNFLRFGCLIGLGSIISSCRFSSQPEVSPTPSDGNDIRPRPVPLPETPIPKEVPESALVSIADWEERGKIPETDEELRETVRLFNKEISASFGPPSLSMLKERKPEKVIQFWPLLSPEEKIMWLEKNNIGDYPEEILTFLHLPHELSFAFDRNNEGKLILTRSDLVIDLESLLIKIPKREEILTWNQLGNFLSPLSEKSLFELGLILNLVMLRARLGKEFSLMSFAGKKLAFREVYGFRSLSFLVEELSIPDKLESSVGTQGIGSFFNLDVFGRLYSLRPHLEKSAPSLWQEFCQVCTPYFFSLMQALEISPEKVWEYYQQGKISEFMKEVGRRIQEKGVKIEGEPEEDLTLKLGFLALGCGDSIVDSESCFQLLEIIKKTVPSNSTPFPERRLI